MREWLIRFFNVKAEEVTLTLNGKTIKRSDCVELGRGSEKRVFKIKDQNLCFFIPHKWSSEKGWEMLIQQEKSLLDQIHELGLKTQRFEITSLEIHEPGKPSYSIPVLVTKDFESLCQEEAIAIYNAKGDTRVIGTSPNFVGQREKFKERPFVQKMFAKIINDYAVALTFSLPISIVHSVDDSEHYCFELSNDPNEVPVARFMFWDVVSDFSGVELPYVPTLSMLKAGNKDHQGNWGLRFLANQIACAMGAMNTKQIANANDSWNFVKGTEADMTLAIDDDNFLNQALVHAREVSVDFLNTFLNHIKEIDQAIDSQKFLSFMKSAISTSDLNLVKQYFHLPNAKALPHKSINKLLEFARQYENQAIIEYLENEKRLEIAARLAPIDNALAELETNISNINQFSYDRAYGEAQILLQALKSSRQIYHAKLEKDDFNVAMENDFKTSCVTAIRVAKPTLEKDLDWGPYIENLLALFVNTILAKAGQEHLFFKLTESQSLKAVQQAAGNIQLDRSVTAITPTF